MDKTRQIKLAGRAHVRDNRKEWCLVDGLEEVSVAVDSFLVDVYISTNRKEVKVGLTPDEARSMASALEFYADKGEEA